jgi:four helix bundle protein
MKNDGDEVLFPFMGLDVYRVAREVAVRVEAAKIGDRELRDQATRAAKSVLLRLSEGLPHRGQGMRRKYFAEAQGSLHELVAAMDVASAMGLVDAGVAHEVIVLGARVRKMISRLQQ